MKYNRILKGQIFIATSGQWDHYEMLGAFVANIDIDLQEVMSEFYRVHSGIGKDFDSDRYQFLKWLCIHKKMCDEITLMELYIGNHTIAPPGNEASIEEKDLASASQYWKEV